MFIQHVRPLQPPHSRMLSVAGPLHLSCRTDMGGSSQGLLSPKLQLCSDVFVHAFCLTEGTSLRPIPPSSPEF